MCCNMARQVALKEKVIAPQTEQEILAALKARIETLSARPDRVTWSRNHSTPLGTQHRVFMNGEFTLEGAIRPRVGGRTLEQLADDTFEAVSCYRSSIGDADVNLVWRVEPEITVHDGEKSIYTRLCFEPALRKVTDDVWVREEIFGG